jgi:hypothetical protein
VQPRRSLALRSPAALTATTSRVPAARARGTTPTHRRRAWAHARAPATTPSAPSRVRVAHRAPVAPVLVPRSRVPLAVVVPLVRRVRVSPVCCPVSAPRTPAAVAVAAAPAVVAVAPAVPAADLVRLAPVAAADVRALVAAVAVAPLVPLVAAAVSRRHVSRSGRSGQNSRCGRRRRLAA